MQDVQYFKASQDDVLGESLIVRFMPSQIVKSSGSAKCHLTLWFCMRRESRGSACQETIQKVQKRLRLTECAA